MVSGYFTSGGVTAYMFAACAILTIALQLVAFTKPFTGEFEEGAGVLDPDRLRAVWDHSIDTNTYLIAALFFYAVGLSLLSHSALCLSKVFRKSQGSKLLFGFFLFGSVFPAIEFLQSIGSQEAAEFYYLETKANITDHGLAILQISTSVEAARSIWLITLVYLFTSAGLLVYASLTFKDPPPMSYKAHSIFGLVISFIGLILFALEIASFFQNSFTMYFAMVGVLYGGILFPIWAIWLGVLLGKTMKPEGDKYALDELEEINMSELEDVDYGVMDSEDPGSSSGASKKEETTVEQISSSDSSDE